MEMDKELAKFAAQKVYLTFQTDRETQTMLKLMAESINMTLPNFIEKICKDYINIVNKLAEENEEST